MSDKLRKKISELVKQVKIEWWNGHQIKRSVVGDWNSKIFQVDGVKYKIGLTVESRCVHNESFVPTKPEINVINYRTGRLYKNEKTEEFLNIPYSVIKDLLRPMIESVTFSSEEIEQNKKDFEEFIISFRRDFLI